MSHISKIKAQVSLKNKEFVKNALKDLEKVFQNLEIKENVKIKRAISRNSLEPSENVDFLVDLGNGYEIGLRKNDKEYEVLADEWYWEINKKENLLNKYIAKIQDFYLLEELKHNAEEEGYTVNWEYNTTNDEIEFEMEKW